MDFSSTLLLVKSNFSIQRKIFSEKNLLEAHIGTGLSIFSKPVCTINELSFYRNNAVYPSLDFGLTFKHFFSNRFFAAMVCNISCQFPSSDKIIIVQPALTAGLTL